MRENKASIDIFKKIIWRDNRVISTLRFHLCKIELSNICSISAEREYSMLVWHT